MNGPIRGVKRYMAPCGRADPHRLGLPRGQIVALHARLPCLEHGEQEAFILTSRLIGGDHIPVARIRLALGKLTLTVCDRRLGSLVGPAELASGVKSAKRVPSAKA
jgi:hypothetical protein